MGHRMGSGLRMEGGPDGLPGQSRERSPDGTPSWCPPRTRTESDDVRSGSCRDSLTVEVISTLTLSGLGASIASARPAGAGCWAAPALTRAHDPLAPAATARPSGQ